MAQEKSASGGSSQWAKCNELSSSCWLECEHSAHSDYSKFESHEWGFVGNKLNALGGCIDFIAIGRSLLVRDVDLFRTYPSVAGLRNMFVVGPIV